MDPIGRLLAGGMALFILWTVVRAWKSGVVFSQGWAFDIDRRPLIYSAAIFCHAALAIFFAALAAGYTPAEQWQFFRMLG